MFFSSTDFTRDGAKSSVIGMLAEGFGGTKEGAAEGTESAAGGARSADAAAPVDDPAVTDPDIDDCK